MGLTLAEFRTLLAIDLKVTVDTEMSKAELNRAVQRAVDDLSRYLPLEAVHEETLDFTITDESITTPAAALATYVVNAKTLNGESDGSTLTVANTRVNPPRRLTVTLTDANYSVTELAITVKGSDQDGHYIEETWSLPTLKVSGTTYQGSSYFSRITAVIVTRVAGSIAAGDTISVGTGNAYDSYIFLANKPIRPQSEEVTSSPAGTTYTRDTDYTMDYTNGAIKFINGGSMAAGTAYLVDYTKSRLGINIGSISPILTRIQRVQYPVDLIPQQFVPFNIIGDFMYVAGKATGQSQEELADKKHIAIYYERRQMPPSEYSPGSYPDVLDEVIAIGAAGYALLTEAQQYEQQAVTDLASMRTELGLTTGIHTLVAAALDKVATYVADMDTALDAAIVQAAAAATAFGKINNDAGRVYLTDADAALDIAAISIGKMSTYLENNTSEDAKSWLTKITTDIAGLRTAFLTAVDAANSYLDSVATTDIDAPTVGAAAWLLEGELLINTVNVGDRVPENFREYAMAKAAIAQARGQAATGYIQEAASRLDDLRTYIEQANGWANIATGFGNEASLSIAEAVQRIGIADRYIAEAAGRTNSAMSYVSEANGRFNMCQAFIQEGQTRIAEIDRHLAEAAHYETAANQDLLLADRFRAEGLTRLNEFHQIMRNKAEYRKRVSSVSVRQPA